MGDVEINQCDTCGEMDVPVQRKYYRYPVKCTCCNGANDNHFEFVYHCKNCKPTPPKKISVYIEPIPE